MTEEFDRDRQLFEQFVAESANRKWPPFHETRKTHVTEPTIRVRERNTEDRQIKEVVMQWYGEADRMDGEYQFEFPLSIRPEDPNLWGRPEWFRIGFVGPLTSWPNQDVVSGLAQSLTKGDINGWIIWLISGQIGVEVSEKITRPQSIAVPFNILLADPNVGIIRPREYFNANVSDEEENKLRENRN